MQDKQPSRVAGYAVHLFTASGAAVALLALRAAMEGRFVAMFLWLGVALFIDGVDGSLARAARVEQSAPMFDGVILDLVIDFMTYVLIPMVALWKSGLMPAELAFWLGAVVVTASALYFADTRMKTKDNWFRGFPAIWNELVFYFFIFHPPVWLSVALILAGTAAMFAPIVVVHPMRVVRLRWMTLAVCAVGGALGLTELAMDFAAPVWVKLGLAACGLYALALPLARSSPWADDSGA